MYKEYLLSYFLVVLLTHVAHSQTSELDYFYHPQYFNDSLIAAKEIKQITVSSYLTVPDEKIYKDNQTVYSFNKNGKLICSESYYFKPHDPETVTLQTIDCNEYKDGLQSRHLRFHDDPECAKWIQLFDYEFDIHGNIVKTTVNDLSVPHNSHINKYDYDKENRLIRSKTDFGYLTEYIYDISGKLVEKNLGPIDGVRSQNCYTYDVEGNLIKYVTTGIPLDNFDTKEEVNQYDEQNRIIFRETTNFENEKSYTKFYYPEKSIVKSEYLNTNRKIISVTTEQFSNDLIQSVVTQKEGIIHAKELFTYEFCH